MRQTDRLQTWAPLLSSQMVWEGKESKWLLMILISSSIICTKRKVYMCKHTLIHNRNISICLLRWQWYWKSNCNVWSIYDLCFNVAIRCSWSNVIFIVFCCVLNFCIFQRCNFFQQKIFTHFIFNSTTRLALFVSTYT